jgi:hypothetical protein
MKVIAQVFAVLGLIAVLFTWDEFGRGDGSWESIATAGFFPLVALLFWLAHRLIRT